jgi:hypothetical protein
VSATLTSWIPEDQTAEFSGLFTMLHHAATTQQRTGPH